MMNEGVTFFVLVTLFIMPLNLSHTISAGLLICSGLGSTNGSHQQRRNGHLERTWMSHHKKNANDHCKSAILFQRLSVLIQRYSAVAFLGTFDHTTHEDEM